MAYIPSAFERVHFDCAAPLSCKVNRKGVDVRSALGRDLTDFEIIFLCGAPRDSQIDVTLISNPADFGNVGDDTPPPGLYFYIYNVYFLAPTVIGIFKDAALAATALYVKDVNLQDAAPTGLGARMLARMMTAAHLLGMSYAAMLAAGGRTWPDMRAPGVRWTGYNAWPRMGFDTLLTKANREMHQHFTHVPRGLSSCTTVQSVLKLSYGKEYWRLAGDGSRMKFDLTTSTSESFNTLNAYLKEKGK
jgi:hypothetical protein